MESPVMESPVIESPKVSPGEPLSPATSPAKVSPETSPVSESPPTTWSSPFCGLFVPLLVHAATSRERGSRATVQRDRYFMANLQIVTNPIHDTTSAVTLTKQLGMFLDERLQISLDALCRRVSCPNWLILRRR